MTKKDLSLISNLIAESIKSALSVKHGSAKPAVEKQSAKKAIKKHTSKSTGSGCFGREGTSRNWSYKYVFDGKVCDTKAEMNDNVKKAFGKDWLPSFERFGFYPAPKECLKRAGAKTTFKGGPFGNHTLVVTGTAV